MKQGIPFWRSIRTKLIMVTIAIEIPMLALLLANSFRLLNAALEQRTNSRIEAVTPLLNAALSSRLFERDHAAIQEIIDQMQKSPRTEFTYIVIYDNHDQPYAHAGNVDVDHMPMIDEGIDTSLQDMVFDHATPLMLGNSRVGQARFGLSLGSLALTRDMLLQQGVLIALIEVFASFLLLAIAGFLLTRHLSQLTRASQRIAAGDYEVSADVSSRDEIGQLSANFNTMASAIRSHIAELKQSQKALHEEKERAEVTLHSIGDGVITTDTQGNVLYLNPTAERMTGHTTGTAQGQPIERIYQTIDEISETKLANPVRLCLAENTVISGNDRTKLVGKEEQHYSIQETTAPILDRQGQMIGVVLVFQDVTEARETARHLAFQSSHDTLTRLPNRTEFERQVEHAIEDANETGHSHAMCYMDLDQFKVVNDTSGHNAGDQLLIDLSKQLRSKIREQDTIARLGGDEFGLLLRNISMDEATALVREVRNMVRDYRFHWEGHSFQIGVSIGVVPIRPGVASLSGIFSNADVACYVAKDKGRNEIHVSDLEDVEQARRQMELLWSRRIPAALKENRFVLYHQRIVPLHEGSRLQPRCELLMRMIGEDGSVILPSKIMPAAERFRQMPDIDRWVIQSALPLIAQHAKARNLASVAINLSGQSLGQPELLEFTKRELLRSKVDPRLVTFEVTETAAIHNIANAIRFMNELRDMGCRFALDDFGSGLSSFGYLKSLPVDYLKIDGSFVRNMVNDEHDRSIVLAISQIAQAMGVRSVAECVEDEATLAALREIGVDYAQGFLLHRPEAMEAASGSGLTCAIGGNDGLKPS